MAALTRSVAYELPEISMEASGVEEEKDVQASVFPIALTKSELPRLVTYKSKSGACSSCSKPAKQSCADCRGITFYCNDGCQSASWPKHKEVCQDLKKQHISEVLEARKKKVLSQVTEYLGKVISSDFNNLNYKKDPNLSVKIDDSAAFGDLYDVSENSENTIRSFHPGLYKCTSVIPDESCEPVTIYHHESVNPVKVMKQCFLMSKDFFEYNFVQNQITMPDWCNWESADEEFIPSDSESETESDVSESDKLFADFVVKVSDSSTMLSDSEDKEYVKSEESESDESSEEANISDHEAEYLTSESKQYLKDLPQKRQSIVATDMDVAEDNEGDSIDVEAEDFKDFKKKVLESGDKSPSKEKLLESGDKGAASEDDSDYLPYSDSDTDSGESIPDRDISDSEKCITKKEVEIMLESSKDIRDTKEELYDEFVDKTLDKNHIEESDVEDQDYVPADEDSASSEDEKISDNEEKLLLEEGKDLIVNTTDKRQSYQTEFSSSESDSDSEVSSEEELFEDFVIHTEAKSDLPETEDVEYVPEQDDDSEVSSMSEDEMEISAAESDALIEDSKEDVKQVTGQKRKVRPSENESQDSDNEAEMESDDELYSDFRSKLIVSDPSKVQDLGGSDDEEFVPAVESQDSQDESQDSQDESQDEGSQASDDGMDVSDDEIKDLELSSEEEVYENFKDGLVRTRRKVKTQKSKSKNHSDNKDLIYFMNAKHTASLKDTLDSGKISSGSEVSGFTLKNGSESFGIAIEMKGRNWRSAYAFEDSKSEKCFALVVTTDSWEHISDNHVHLETHYPDQKWTSVAETKLKFQMESFC